MRVNVVFLVRDGGQQMATIQTAESFASIKLHLFLISVRICKMSARYLVLFTLASLSPLLSTPISQCLFLTPSLTHSRSLFLPLQ